MNQQLENVRSTTKPEQPVAPGSLKECIHDPAQWVKHERCPDADGRGDCNRIPF